VYAYNEVFSTEGEVSECYVCMRPTRCFRLQRPVGPLRHCCVVSSLYSPHGSLISFRCKSITTISRCPSLFLSLHFSALLTSQTSGIPHNVSHIHIR
jgi:hypothetical protein